MKYINLFFYLFILVNIFCNSIYAFENPIIETDKVILRVMKLEDANDLYEITSDARVAKLTALFKLHYTLEDTKNYIERSLSSYKNKATIPWVIVIKQTNKVIGIFLFFNYIPTSFKAEIGYALNLSYWNQGICTDSTKAVLKYCFNQLGLNRIQATFDPLNIASRRVLEKTGFKYEGYLRSYYYLNNQFLDRVIYSILKTDL